MRLHAVGVTQCGGDKALVGSAGHLSAGGSKGVRRRAGRQRAPRTRPCPRGRAARVGSRPRALVEQRGRLGGFAPGSNGRPRAGELFTSSAARLPNTPPNRHLPLSTRVLVGCRFGQSRPPSGGKPGKRRRRGKRNSPFKKIAVRRRRQFSPLIGLGRALTGGTPRQSREGPASCFTHSSIYTPDPASARRIFVCEDPIGEHLTCPSTAKPRLFLPSRRRRPCQHLPLALIGPSCRPSPRVPPPPALARKQAHPLAHFGR